MYIVLASYACLILSLILLVTRLRFLKRAQLVRGKVTGFRYLDSRYDDRGRSKHLEIQYQSLSGEQRLYVLDNSLLAYWYKVGSVVKLALYQDKVLLAEWGHILTAPIVLAAMGGVCLLF